MRKFLMFYRGELLGHIHTHVVHAETLESALVLAQKPQGTMFAGFWMSPPFTEAEIVHEENAHDSI